jgi:glycosyltransferase involved in cell wall biosynthesis
MKIFYITNARIPTEKAHGFQICKMCEEFAAAGAEVELIVPTRINLVKDEPHHYYGLKDNFKISYIRCFDFIPFNRWILGKGIYLNGLAFLLKMLFVKFDKDACIYTRSPEIAWLFSVKKYKVFYEAHSWPGTKNSLLKKMLSKAELIICNSKGTKNVYEKNGFTKLLVAPNGVDLEKFNLQIGKQECREKLNLPLDKKIVMYVGHLYDWKGTDVLADAASLFPPDTEIIFMGGAENDVKKYQIKYEKTVNAKFFGKKLRSEIPVYLKAADVLVLPNVPITDESSFFTSPIKMFEYMASGTPIAASALPSIKEILNDDNAVLFEPGERQELFKAVTRLLDDYNFAQKISAQSLIDAQKYSWEKRAGAILKMIKY